MSSRAPSILGDEKPGDLALNVQGDEDRSRLGVGLDSRGHVRRIAEYLAVRLHDDRPGLDSDARFQLRRAPRRVPGVEVGERALDRKRRPHGALGVVLPRLRIAKQRHQPVAEPLQHVAAETGHRLRRRVEIGVDEVAPVLGVEPGGKARRPDKVAKHHRDRAALGIDARSRLRSGRDRGRGQSGGRARGGRRGRRLGRRAERGDRVEEFSPVADDRDAEIFQIFGRQARQEVAVDRVVAERRFVLPETEVVEPGRDVHGRLHSQGSDNRLRPGVCKASANLGAVEQRANVREWRVLPVTPTAAFWRSPPVPGSILKGSKGSTPASRKRAEDLAGVEPGRSCRRTVGKVSKGGDRVYRGHLGKGRSPRHSRHSIANA